MNKLISKYSMGLLLLLSGFRLNAQLVYNNGAKVYTHAGAEVYVLGDGIENNTGIIENAGYWFIDGDMVNSDSLTGFGQNSGVYEVREDWINNSVLRADQSEVILSGDDQIIGGTAPSSFFNLSLFGSGIKTQSINAEVQNTLDLSDIELDSDENEMFVSNSNSTAIIRNTGFVSSQGVGRLAWNLAAGSTYFYPVGFHLSNSDLRPVELTANNAGVYKVRLAEGEATNEGYPFSQFNAPGICKVNRDYFHYIDAQLGGNTDISIFSHATDDYLWDRIVQWNGGEWNDTELPGLSSQGVYNVVSINDWQDFSDPVFDLASSDQPTLDFVQDQIEIDNGEMITLEAQYSDDETDLVSYDWSPTQGIASLDGLMADVYPAESTTYGLQVTNELGCTAFDQVAVKVNDRGLVLPTAFSPNGDGTNDVLEPLNYYLSVLNYSIYNRWGQLIFEGSLDHAQWDGTFRNVDQPVGVYTYVAKFKLVNGNKEYLEGGNVTLVR